MEKKRTWTDNELTYLKNNWPKKSEAEIADILGKSKNAVKIMRYKVNLRCENHGWTEEDIDYLVKHWKEQTDDELAKHFGKSASIIQQKRNSLKLLRRKTGYNRKPWTTEEIEYLYENWGIVAIPSIAKKLGRSENSIIIKKNKLGLGPFLENDEYITFNQLLHSLGVHAGSGYFMTSWVKNRNFPLKYKKVNDCSFKVVYLQDFWKWAEKNRTMIDWSRVEINVLGREPAWVKKQRELDYQRNIKVKKTPWTKAEDQYLQDLLKQFKYSCKDLAQKLHRSEGAIQRRILALNLKERPLKADNHIKWTDEEYRQLGEMIKQRLSYETMSEVLGKSVKAIRGRVYSMYLTENLDKAAALIGNGSWGDNRPERKITHLCLNTQEKLKVKNDLTKLVSILKGEICKYYEGSEYWQRGLCANWDDRCLAGEDSCDYCESFVRIQPQYCRRCGATFYKRIKADMCDRCKIARKKQYQKKWMILHGENKEKRGA